MGSAAVTHRRSNSLESHEFAFLPFLRKEYRFGISPSRPYCAAFRAGHCPLGADCPDKHPVTHSSNNLICKHWLKGLCKKGDACDFLHEYNIRARLECNHFTRGYCGSGDDCNYLHLDAETRKPVCANYEKGFCELGPQCAKRHVRRKLCPLYLAGFCPNGRTCMEGVHARFPEDLPKSTVRPDKIVQEAEEERIRYKEEMEKRDEMDWERGGRGDGRGRGRRGYGRGRRGGYDR